MSLNIAELKKLNSRPVSKEEVPTTVKQTSSHEQTEITAENIQIILGEQLSLSALIRGKIQQSEINETSLTKKLEESERLRNLEIKDFKSLVAVLNKKMEELREENYQKLERASAIIREEAKNSHETNSKIIREVMELARLVEFIPKLNWKERAKQYGTQLLITLGLATVLLGAFRLVILLTTLLKH